MRGELKRLQKRLQATTIYVTHDQAEATTMADLVVVMHDGRLQQVGPPLGIYDRPANRFVATFVGSPPLNVVPGKLDAVRRAFVVAGRSLRLDEPVFVGCAAAAVNELGVRPEDLQLCDPGQDGSIGGEVYVVEPLGNETLVEVRLADSVLTVRAERGWSAPIGSPVGIRLAPASACFFDRSGVTAVHRTDRPETRRPDHAVTVGTATEEKGVRP
jgi:multiple sugar transport system ATP-binding protein